MKKLLFASLLAVSVVLLDGMTSTNFLVNPQVVKEAAWQAQVFIASTNTMTKLTPMISPLNSNGQIIEIDVLTYWRYGKMRYATNRFDRLKDK